jgi:hypothetical protein
MADINQFQATVDLPVVKKPATTADCGALLATQPVWNGKTVLSVRWPTGSSVLVLITVYRLLHRYWDC